MLHARPSEAMSDLDPPTDQLSFKEHHPFPFRLPPSLRPSVLRHCVGRRRFSPSSELGLLQIFLVTTKVALLSTTNRNAQRNLRSPWRHFLLASLRFYPAPCRDRLDVERACECPLQPLPLPLPSPLPLPGHPIYGHCRKSFISVTNSGNQDAD